MSRISQTARRRSERRRALSREATYFAAVVVTFFAIQRSISRTES